MNCPGCRVQKLTRSERIRIAARMTVQCPGCGATLRFGRLPRVVHSIFGDAMLVTSAIGAYLWNAPVLLLASGGLWSVLA